MNPDLRQIRAFVTVAQLGSFTRAASLLNLSQPALTVQIRNLEEALGVRLFDRNTRTVSLTRMGRELVPALQRILRDLDAVVAEARDVAAQRHGIVRLAALPSFAAGVLPEIIAQFRETNPKISFVIHDVIASGVIAQVREEQVDLGLTGGRIVDPISKCCTRRRTTCMLSTRSAIRSETWSGLMWRRSPGIRLF